VGDGEPDQRPGLSKRGREVARNAPGAQTKNRGPILPCFGSAAGDMTFGNLNVVPFGGLNFKNGEHCMCI